jgi:small subunit ribosomal protein S20
VIFSIKTILEKECTLANHKSALKRAGQNELRRMRNKTVKTRVKNVVKGVRGTGDAEGDAAINLNAAQSVIDKAAKKGVIHKKTAARKISRLSRLVNSANA